MRQVVAIAAVYGSGRYADARPAGGGARSPLRVRDIPPQYMRKFFRSAGRMGYQPWRLTRRGMCATRHPERVDSAMRALALAFPRRRASARWLAASLSQCSRPWGGWLSVRRALMVLVQKTPGSGRGDGRVYRESSRSSGSGPLPVERRRLLVAMTA